MALFSQLHCSVVGLTGTKHSCTGTNLYLAVTIAEVVVRKYLKRASLLSEHNERKDVTDILTKLSEYRHWKLWDSSFW